MRQLSLRRIGAVLIKEFIQLRRDRMTFGMILGLPLAELVLFGFAINTDPKQLPTAVFVQDHSAYSRAVVNAFENSGYFRIVHENTQPGRGRPRSSLRGEVTFVLTIPEDFTRALLRNERPQVLLRGRRHRPGAASNALAAATQLAHMLRSRTSTSPPAGVEAGAPPFELVAHRSYNPEGIAQYNTVPGLLGVILTMTMVMMPALALTRELERGTMENLLALPVSPVEIMLGKVLPYIGMGAIQVLIVLGVARWMFAVPMLGSYPLLFAMVAVFVVSLATIGYLISTVARNADAGDADDVLLLHALDAAVGIHVPVSRPAGLGAGHRRGAAAHAHAAHRARHHAEGRRIRRGRATPRLAAARSCWW